MLDDRLHAKIGDFGIATRSTLVIVKHASSPPPSPPLTSDPPVDVELPKTIGTLRYLAPEKLFSRFDETGDVYSFALFMWEVLHGVVAFHEFENTNVLFMAHAGHRPPIVLPAPLRPYEPLLQLCWQPEPACRPTMPEVVEWLGQLMAEGRGMHAAEMATESDSVAPPATPWVV
eukprot:942663-Prymnesium_polylepis.1